MIIFDQLRISDDGKRMYINAHVNKADLFTDTTIERLCICLGDKVYEATTIDPESNSIIYNKVYPEGIKEINEVVSIDDEDLIYNKVSFKELYFVYIKCANVPDEGKCFSAVGKYSLGVTFDENLLYQAVMNFTKGLAEDCNISAGFTDFILLWNAFKASIETEHYIPAVKFWNMLFEGHAMTTYKTTKPCGCHG